MHLISLTFALEQFFFAGFAIFFGRCAEICDLECKTCPIICWCTTDPHAAAPELNQHLLLFNWGAETRIHPLSTKVPRALRRYAAVAALISRASPHVALRFFPISVSHTEKKNKTRSVFFVSGCQQPEPAVETDLSRVNRFGRRKHKAPLSSPSPAVYVGEFQEVSTE